MRPEILFPLFADVTRLPGVGPKTAALIAKVAGTRVVDVLFRLPTGLVDRSRSPSLADARDGEIATLTLEVFEHRPNRQRGRPYRVVCGDGSGFLDIVYFRGEPAWLEQTFPVGAKRIVSGRIESWQGRRQMAHPDYAVPPERAADIPAIEPVYPLTEGLSARVLRKAAGDGLSRLPQMPDWLDPAHAAKTRWPAFSDALIAAHAPEGTNDIAPEAPARARLAYDELLANQLALALVRARQRGRGGRALKGDGSRTARLDEALPFTPTAAQRAAIAEIAADMRAPQRMVRLLQGDVGAGKTLVALYALTQAVEAGAQGALMAPTEILARQHLTSVAPLAEAAGLRIALLTGREKGAGRADMLGRLARGDIDILIGTHALFSDDVAFADLGLVVVDEQHRFGVHQRLKLAAKGAAAPDLLVMTATPIPRTLALTAYGDMDVSRLTGKPPGRKPVTTRAMAADRYDEVVAAVRRAIARDDRVYWVCPLVEESETVDAAAAQARAEDLKSRLGATVGLLHGRMKGPEKDKAMAAFKAGLLKVLVATTVIEVGVDVPEASVMVVEHAERFGLAQLHQLRGRVGRGGKPGACLLLYQKPLGETARARIAILRESDDGFRIAEEDLRLRGPGDVLGAKQSGLPAFRLADLAAHADLIQTASDDARLIVARDPQLASARGRALRVLLYLFDRDEAVRLLTAG